MPDSGPHLLVDPLFSLHGLLSVSPHIPQGLGGPLLEPSGVRNLITDSYNLWLPLALAPPDVPLCGPHAGGGILRGALDCLALGGWSVLLGWFSLHPASKFFVFFFGGPQVFFVIFFLCRPPGDNLWPSCISGGNLTCVLFCPLLRSGHFRRQKGLGPLEKPIKKHY